MKKELSQKLKFYAGLTSSLITGQWTNGQIVYTDPADILITTDPPSHYLIDMNNDGVAECELFGRNSPGNTNILQFWSAYAFVSVLGKYGTCAGPFDLEIYGENRGAPINPKAEAWQPCIGDYRTAFICEETFAACGNEEWAGKKNKFIGLRWYTDDPHQKYYGWIRLNVTPDGKSLKIKDWAYNATPNKGLSAGARGQFNSGKEIFVEDDNTPLSPVVFSSGKDVVLRDNFQEEQLAIHIYNSLGQLIKEVKTSDPSNTIDLQDAPAGIYIVNVNGNKTSFSKQLMIQ